MRSVGIMLHPITTVHGARPLHATTSLVQLAYYIYYICNKDPQTGSNTHTPQECQGVPGSLAALSWCSSTELVQHVRGLVNEERGHTEGSTRRGQQGGAQLTKKCRPCHLRSPHRRRYRCCCCWHWFPRLYVAFPPCACSGACLPPCPCPSPDLIDLADLAIAC